MAASESWNPMTLLAASVGTDILASVSPGLNFGGSVTVNIREKLELKHNPVWNFVALLL